MATIEDHPLRYPLSHELHARPFPVLAAPARAVFLAIKVADAAVARDRTADREHLCALLDRYGAPHPLPEATHHMAVLGKNRLKWESHTEFVTFTVFLEGCGERSFDPADFAVFPDEWLAQSPGQRLTSAMIRIVPRPPVPEIRQSLADWFVAESLAVAHVLDDAGIIAGDFHIDPAGHQRFALFVSDGTGNQRVGRVVQRLCEIETYKSVSMLGFARARGLVSRMNAIDAELSGLMAGLGSEQSGAEQTLGGLLQIARELEALSARNAFRFSATRAYSALVSERIAVLREERFEGRQTFDEFMMRRFDPAMRTTRAAEDRIAAMSERATRAGELLRTQVDVARSAQNQALLASMDARADTALRLQTTVEGLSVVAISYYAVSLLAYVIAPFSDRLGFSKAVLVAAAAPLVVLGVWAMVRRIRRRLH